MLSWWDRRSAYARPTVAAGQYHSVFVDEGGRMLTCGTGLGCSTTDEVTLEVPTPSPSLAGIRVHAVAAGEHHTLLLTASDGVFSFGDGQNGELGHGDRDAQIAPRPIDALRGMRVAAVAVGWFHSVVLLADGDERTLTFGHGGRSRDSTPSLL